MVSDCLTGRECGSALGRMRCCGPMARRGERQNPYIHLLPLLLPAATTFNFYPFQIIFLLPQVLCLRELLGALQTLTWDKQCVKAVLQTDIIKNIVDFAQVLD